MSTDDPSQIMNYLVRMVVPLRREFGRNLDVGQFLHDLAYAREVIDEALSSQDPRLRDYANYVAQRLQGPRIANSQAAAAASVTQPAPLTTQPAPLAAPVTPANSQQAAEEAALRARMMKKYTDGLR